MKKKLINLFSLISTKKQNRSNNPRILEFRFQINVNKFSKKIQCFIRIKTKKKKNRLIEDVLPPAEDKTAEKEFVVQQSTEGISPQMPKFKF